MKTIKPTKIDSLLPFQNAKNEKRTFNTEIKVKSR